jgi:integrase
MTRYPKTGKGTKWTVRELKAVTQDWRGDSLADSEGLTGEVRANNGNVSIRWKYAYKWQTKLCWYSCGTFPDHDIATIRERRNIAKKQLADGVNPSVAKVAEKIINQQTIEMVIAYNAEKLENDLTVNDLYQVWLTDGVARKDGNKNLIRSFDKDVLPQIGKLPVRTLSEKHLRDLYKGVIARGVQRTAIDLSNSIGQMLRWAEKRQPWRGLLAEGNPAQLVDVKKLVSHDYTEERSRVLSENEIRELRDIFKTMQTTYDKAENKYDVKKPLALHTQKTVWLCLSSLCRIGELLLTKWRHIDFEKREWFIPQENSKGQRNKKQDQVIYLSDFALRQFSELKANATSDKWVFPSRNDADNHIDLKTISKQVGDRQFQFKSRSALLNRTNDDSLVLSGGQNGEWTPHDLRRTGATMMQALGVGLDVIDRCQNHLIAGSKVRRHYLHYDYHTEKREAWAKLGERIEQILSAKNLVFLRGAA